MNGGTDNNYFNTGLATGAYSPGDARGDVAGNPVSKGAAPTGANGIVNAADIDYVRANFYSGTWGSNLDNHATRDLSADMNGDLIVDVSDIAEIVVSILDTQIGDVNLDGVVNCADVNIIRANFGIANPGWAVGDVNSDGAVTTADEAIALALAGTCP
jgi:hypothetical protein